MQLKKIIFYLLLLTICTSLKGKINTQNQDVLNKLCLAINNKNLVRFYYKDKYSDNEDWRIVEPHLVGNHNSTGNIILVGWSIPTSNQLKLGNREKWGNYIIDRIKSIEVLDTKFIILRNKYNPNDSRMSNIFCYAK